MTRMARWSIRLLLLSMSIGIADSASAYSLCRTFNNPTPAPQDFFGTSIATVNNDLLVSAPQQDAGAIDAGSVYLFDGNPTSPAFGSLLTTFHAPNPSPHGDFGSSMASVGKNVLIGESFRYASGPDRNPGATYLFDGDPSSPTFGQLLKTFQAPDPQNADMMGFSVAGMGTNVLVGAFGNNTGARRAGEAYMFDGDPDSPTFGNLLTVFHNPHPDPQDHFGVAITAIGKNVLVGAFRDDVGGVDAGAAYLFDGDPTSPTFGQLLTTLTNPNPSPTDLFGHNDEFGHSVARVGNNCLVGAFREDIGAFDAGAAYLFDCNPHSPTFGKLLTTFVNPSPVRYGSGGLGENFSFSMTSMGNYALIGAWRQLGGLMSSGAAYVYNADPNSPSFGQLVAALKSPTPRSYGSFGASIAVAGENIFFGEIGTDGGAGSAHLFTKAGPPQLLPQQNSQLLPQQNSQLLPQQNSQLLPQQSPQLLPQQNERGRKK